MPSVARCSAAAATLLLLAIFTSGGAPRSTFIPEAPAAIWAASSSEAVVAALPAAAAYAPPAPPTQESSPPARFWDAWPCVAAGVLLVGALAGTRTKAAAVASPDPEAVHLASESAAGAARIAALAVEGAAERIYLNNLELSRPLQPVGNQVLVKIRVAQEKTGGGLFVVEAETPKPKEGIVVAAGPGGLDENGETVKCPVAPGDLVLLSDYTGEKVDYNGQKHIFVDGETILGTFTDGQVSVDSFKPLGDRVLVVMAKAATETSTGIALAQSEDEDDNMGEVVAVGEGTVVNGKLKPTEISAGESVLYARNAGAVANFDDNRRYVIVSESDCLAKW